MKNPKFYFSAFISLFLALLLAACAPNTGGRTAGENKKQPVHSNELNVVVTSGLSCEAGKYLTHYRENNPETAVYITYNDDIRDDFYGTKTLENIKSGEISADIIIIDSSNIAPYLQADVLMDLSGEKAITQMLANEKLVDGLEKFYLIGKKTIGIPAQIYYSGFVVNTPLFNKTGLNTPADGWDYEDFYELAKQSIAFDEYYLMCTERPMFTFINPWSGVNYSGGFTTIYNTAEYIKYMEMARELTNSGAYLSPADVTISSDEEYMELFWSENSFLYPFDYSDLHDFGGFPKRLAGSTVLQAPRVVQQDVKLNTQLFCVAADAKNKGAALDFLSGFIDEHYQRQNASEFMMYKDLYRYTNMHQYPASIESWMLDSVKNSTMAFLPVGLWDYMNDELYEKLENSLLSMEDCAQLMQKRADEIFAE